jgi:hypothetical protein
VSTQHLLNLRPEILAFLYEAVRSYLALIEEDGPRDDELGDVLEMAKALPEIYAALTPGAKKFVDTHESCLVIKPIEVTEDEP